MLSQSQAGGPTEAINCNSWLASIPTTAKPSGPTNPPWTLGRVNEPTIEESEDDSLKWAAQQFSELLDKYRGQWILVRTQQVIDSSTDPIKLLQRAIDLGITKPLMLRIEPSEAARRMVFVTW